MRLSVTILLLSLICCCSARAVEITYSGTRPGRAESLDAVIANLLATGVDRAVVCDSAVSRLQSDGYVEATVQWQNDSLKIVAGPRYTLEKLVIEDTLEVESGSSPLTEATWRDLASLALQQLGDRGNYFARLEPDSILVRGTAATVYAHVVPGPTVTIAKRVLSGLKRSRPSMMKRYLTVQEGDTLTDEALRLTEIQASTIPFVQFVPPIIVLPLPGYTEADIELAFREKRQVEVSGGAGYISEEPSYLVWNLDLRLANLFGDGRSASLLSERLDRKRQRLDLAYGQPLFFAGVGYLDVNVATRDFRDDFSEFSASGRYGLRVMSGGSVGLGLGWKRVEPSNTLLATGYSAYSVQFDISQSVVDNPRNPASGFRVSASVAYVYRRYRDNTGLATPEQSAFNETRSRLSLAGWAPVTGWLVGHTAVTYSGIETGEVEPPLSELILVGGPGTLRGYRNGQFAAQRAVCGTLEPHLRFGQGYAFIFSDAAYINRRLAESGGGSKTEELYRAGYGAGMALDDGRRSVRLSLGWGQEARFNQPRLSVEFSSDL
jgi:outer membrane protein assembly factor BamA